MLRPAPLEVCFSGLLAISASLLFFFSFSFNHVKLARIELAHRAPKARVLPLYYNLVAGIRFELMVLTL